MSGERLQAITTPVLTELTLREQLRAVKGLLDSNPVERFPVLEAALDLEATRIRTLAMTVLAQTAEELPDEALNLAERVVRDKNDRVSAAAVMAAGAATVTAPEKAIPVLEYAFTRKARVREAVGALVVRLFEADQDSGLPFLIKMVEDEPNNWRNSRHIEKIICENLELFDLENNTPSSDAELELNPYRKLLEKQLATNRDSVICLAKDLIKENPELALNILLLAENLKAKHPIDEKSSSVEKLSQVGLFLTSRFWSGKTDEDAPFYYDLIQAHPEARVHLDRDIEWVKSNGFERSFCVDGRSWLSACKAIPALKERLAEFFTDHTRRISDTAEEYVLDREKCKGLGEFPEIFGFGAVDVHGMGTQPGSYRHELQHYKHQIKYILNEGKIQRQVSQATLEKVRYLKSLFQNSDPEEVNDERLRNFFKYHVDEQMVAYRESMARVGEWQERFLARLPVYLDRQIAKRRIEETRVVFF